MNDHKDESTKSDIPRWHQGFRPYAHGETWDAMTPRERRGAFVGDLVVGFGGAGLLWFLATLFTGG